MHNAGFDHVEKIRHLFAIPKETGSRDTFRSGHKKIRDTEVFILFRGYLVKNHKNNT
jgi:hypothetical protein